MKTEELNLTELTPLEVTKIDGGSIFPIAVAVGIGIISCGVIGAVVYYGFTTGRKFALNNL